MKKTFFKLTIFSSTLIFLLFGAVALAQEVSIEDSIKGNLEPIENVYAPVDDVRPGSLQETIAKIIRQLLGFLGIIFIILILYGGWKWMTAAGNESNIETAKAILTAAIIGLAIILVAYGVAQFITTQLLEATGATT